MNDQWGPREYAPDRQPMTNRARTPGTAAAQQAYLSVGAVALTMAALSSLFEHIGAIEIGRGAYAILAGLFVVGGCGWAVCRSEARIRRDLADKVDVAESRVRQELGGKVEELTAVLAELSDQIAHQRVTYPAPPRRHNTGQRYVGAVPVGTDDTTQSQGLDEDSIAAARRITMRLRNVDSP